MFGIQFASADLANVRFAVSPLIELWQSVRALQSPAAKSLHAPWLADARDRVGDLDVAQLCALQPIRGRSPDFIHPPPTEPLAEFEGELARMLATPPARIRLEVASAYRGKPVPPSLRAFVEQPDAAVVRLADLLRAYWQRALAPNWDRIRTVLDGDVLYRARQTAVGGMQTLFGDIDQKVRYEEPRLVLDKSWGGLLKLNGRGLLFVPSVFVWPALVVVDEGPWQPTLIYPARGSGVLWEPRWATPEALGALIGKRRASILASLDAPHSTTGLARRLDVTPGNISQHLGVLQNAGLVRSHRVGRSVLYSRSTMGEVLAHDESRANGHIGEPPPGP